METETPPPGLPAARRVYVHELNSVQQLPDELLLPMRAPAAVDHVEPAAERTDSRTCAPKGPAPGPEQLQDTDELKPQSERDGKVAFFALRVTKTEDDKGYFELNVNLEANAYQMMLPERQAALDGEAATVRANISDHQSPRNSPITVRAQVDLLAQDCSDKELLITEVVRMRKLIEYMNQTDKESKTQEEAAATMRAELSAKQAFIDQLLARERDFVVEILRLTTELARAQMLLGMQQASSMDGALQTSPRSPPMEEGGEFARSTRLSNGTPSSGLGVVLGTITEELESSRPSSPESPARRSSWSDARSPVRRLSCEVSGGGGAADIDARRGQPELVDSACALLLAVDEAAALVACLDAELRRDAKESDDARRRHAVECALLQRRLDDAVAQVWHAWLRSIF